MLVKPKNKQTITYFHPIAANALGVTCAIKL